MLHDDYPFTPEEVDEQIAWLERTSHSQPPTPNTQVIQGLHHLYENEQADAHSVDTVWQRLQERGAVPAPQPQRARRSGPSRRQRESGPPPQAYAPAAPARRGLSTRLLAIAAAALLVVVVSGLVGGLVLVRDPAHVISHPTTTPGGVAATATRSGTAATATPQPPQGVVYAVSNGNTVVALDAATGSTRWQQPFKLASGATLSIAAIEDQTVYVETLVSYPSQGQDILTALNTSDGTQVWQTHVDLDHGLTISGGVVFTLNSTGYGPYGILALDAQTGQSLWSFYPGLNLVSASGEVVRGNTLYTEGYDNYGNGFLFAFNIRNGTEIWHLQGPGDVSSYFSLMAVTDDSLYVGSYIFSLPRSAGQPPSTVSLLALNTSDGTERWHFQANQADESWLSATVSNGVVYVSANDFVEPNSSGVLYALQASDGKALWQKQPVQEKSFFSPLAVSQGVVYISDNSGMYAFNGGSGQQMWYTTSGGGANGSPLQPPVVQDGLVYMGWYGNSTTTQGNTTVFLSVLDASSGKERWHFVIFDGSGRDASGIDIESSWLAANGGVYIPTYVATGAPGVQVLRASDGKPLWQNNTLTSLMVAAG